MDIIHVLGNLPKRVSTAKEPLNNQIDKIILPTTVSLFFQLKQCFFNERDAYRLG